MNLESADSLNLEVLDPNTMTVLESMMPTDGHSAQQMVIYVQTNPQGGGQVISMPEEIPLSAYPGVETLEPFGTSGEQIVALVDDLGQALGEGQAVPVTLSDVAKIGFVDSGGEMFQAEDGQVLYLTYTVDSGTAENSLSNELQPSSDMEMVTGLNISSSSSQIQQQIVLHMGNGEGNYMVASGDNNELSLTNDNSVPTLEIPEVKKPVSGKSKKRSVVNQNNQRKTAQIVGPEVFIEDKLQVLEAMVPRVERPKKKKLKMKSTKEESKQETQEESCSKDERTEKSDHKKVDDVEKPKEDKRDENTKEDGLYMCDLCGNSYSRAAQYYGHLHSHSGERDWKCQRCDEVFKSHSQLHLHEARSHLNMRPYPCSICGSRFDRVSQLHYHERRIHAGEKPHQCLICSKGFFKRSDLRTHVNIHLGINKSICETCGKQFNHVSNLIRHTRVHTGIKPYPCNICGRRFSQVNALQHHKDSHNTSRDFACNLCSKQFKSNFLLRKHIRSMHSSSNASNQEEDVKAVIQNRRFYCKICGEDFPFSAMLKDHEAKHQKETNFHCNCCGNDYTSAQEFKFHSCFDVEEGKSNSKEDSVKKYAVNSYSELIRSITSEDTMEDKAPEPKCQKDSRRVEKTTATLRKGSGTGADTTKSQERALRLVGSPTDERVEEEELVMRMEDSPRDEGVEDEQDSGSSESEKIEGGAEDSRVSNTLSMVHSSDVEASWVVEPGCASGEPHSEEKWLNLSDQTDSEIVIYVAPSVPSDPENKKGPLSDETYFKKYNSFVASELHENDEEYSIPSVDPLAVEPGECITDQIENHLSSVDPLIGSNSEGSSMEAADPLDCSEDKSETELPLVLGNSSTVSGQSEKTKVPSKTFKCDECGKIFAKSSNYKQHLGIHFVDLQRYQCKVCGQSFAWKSTLNKHMSNIHQTGPAPKFTCGFCSKEYTTSSQVQEHIKRDHFKERPHTCTECHKTFYKKYDLKVHLRTHTKEKPYICGACGKAFYHLSHIIRHERIHTGERPYKCDDCGREFNQSSTLKTHKSRHSNCPVPKKKLDTFGKGLSVGEGAFTSLQESGKRSRGSKKASAACKLEAAVDKVILTAKDPNLNFDNIPATYVTME